MRRVGVGRLAVLALLALLLGGSFAAVASGGSPASPSQAASWAPVGELMAIDVPKGSGTFLDLDPFRAGTQVVVVVLYNATDHRLRLVTVFGTLVGESPAGSFVPRGTLNAGWRAFAWGSDQGGAARLWSPVFDSAHSLLSLDPQLRCGSAAGPSAQLAGPFSVVIPAGAKPGGRTVANPASALVFGNPADPAHGVRVATTSGVELGRTNGGANVAQGGFGFAGAVFAYGTKDGVASLWSPLLVGTSTDLVREKFAACSPSGPPPAKGTIELRKVWGGTAGNVTLKIGTSAGGSEIASKALTATDGKTGQSSVDDRGYYLSETFDSPTSAGDYSTALACFNDANNNGGNDGEPVVTVGAGNSVTVGTGQHVVCTLTNTRKTGTIAFAKVVDGGSAQPGDFTFSINGETYKHGDSHAFDTGDYTLTENAVDGYTLTAAGGACTLANGVVTLHVTTQAATCAITNTRAVTFDGNVTPVKDEARAVSAAVGPAGGTITVGGMTLAIPAGALHDQQTITITPLSSIGGSPFHELIGAVDLQPQGLHFLVPATLTIPRPAGLVDSQIVGFGFNGNGTGFHLKPNDHSGGPIVLQVLHFSGDGAANATPTEVNHTLGYEPTPAQELAEQQIAAAQNQFPNLSDQLFPTFNALNDWFDHSVYIGLGVVGDSLDNLELALGEWVAWAGEVENFRQNFDLPTAFSQNLALGLRRAIDDAAHIADLLLAGCRGAGAHPLESLRPVVRLSADLQAIEASRAGQLAIENTITPEGRRLPPATALPSSCAHVKIEGITHAPALAFLHDNSYTADAGVVFWNATGANHSIPLVLTLFDQTEVVIPPTVVRDGHLKTNVNPTSLGNRAYVLMAELEAAEADDTLKPLSDQMADTTPVRARIDLQSDATIKPGATVHLKTLLAGDGMVNGTVAYAIDGVGSLSATSGTTDANGEADVDYTAPPDNHPAVARVTASFDDGTGPVVGLVKITIKPDVKVVVTPATVQLPTGGTTQFSAAVTGVNDPSVTWSKSGGTIDQTGLYTAPQAPGTYTVTATSNEDPAAKDSATVTVVSSGTMTVTARCQNALASAEAWAARADGTTVGLPGIGASDPFCGLLGPKDSIAAPPPQIAVGDGGATAHADASAEVIATTVAVTNGRLSVTASVAARAHTGQTQGSVLDPVDGFPLTLNAEGTAEASAALTVEFTVSGQPVPFGCSGDARIQLRSNGQQVFLGPTQVTLQPGSYQLTVSASVAAYSPRPFRDPGGRLPSAEQSGSMTCS